MLLIPLLLKEMEQETATTRKMLERVPDDKFDWKPHPKSMTLKQLATHIAEIPAWISMAINTSDLDFGANPYKPTEVASQQALLDLFEKSVAAGKADLEKTTDDFILNGTWQMRSGDHIFFVLSKYETIRHAFSQSIHHRAQLGVFLRLLDIPIPGSYGPSADESSF